MKNHGSNAIAQKQDLVRAEMRIGTPWTVRGEELVRVYFKMSDNDGEAQEIVQTVSWRTAMRAKRVFDAAIVDARGQGIAA